MEVADPHRNRTTHMIRPSAQSESYAAAEGLRPFRQWVRLTNADTFISGPFEFAVINGRKSRDRVGGERWKILAKFSHLFANEIPSLELPDYSVHCGQCHFTFEDSTIGDHVMDSLANPLRFEAV